MKSESYKTQMAIVMNECANHFGCTVGSMMNGTRVASIVRARHTAAFMIRRMIGGVGYGIIASAMRRDRSSIIHAIRRIGREIDSENLNTLRDVQQLSTIIASRRVVPPHAATIARKLDELALALSEVGAAVADLRSQFVATYEEPELWPKAFETNVAVKNG